MAYDEELAERVRALLAAHSHVTEKKMFGGLAFLIGGHLAVAVSGQGGLMVRCAPDETNELLERGAEPMVMRGKELAGWLRLGAGAVASDRDLADWVEVGAAYAATLPAE